MFSTSSPVLPHALDLPIFRYLKDKRVVLASTSVHRKERLEASSQEKAMEVYHRLVAEDPRTAPDLLISGDTVVIFYPCTSVEIADDASTIASGTALARLNISNDSDRETQDFGKGHNKGKSKQVPSGCKGRKGVTAKILEKPKDKDEQYKTLMMLNGQKCEIVTGVTIMYPTAAAPGYESRSIAVSTLVEFNDNSPDLIKAYVQTGEGLTRCGGFTARFMGGLLVKTIHGDYDNVTGFPTAAFWRWMTKLYEEGVFQ